MLEDPLEEDPGAFAGDRELIVVVVFVVRETQRDDVDDVMTAAVFLVFEMVHLETETRAATRNRAAAVIAGKDLAADPWRDTRGDARW